jgi:hypothetical protein
MIGWLLVAAYEAWTVSRRRPRSLWTAPMTRPFRAACKHRWGRRLATGAALAILVHLFEEGEA